MVSPRSGLALLALPLFLVSAVLVAPACGSSVETNGTAGSTGTGTTTACPTETPQQDAACSGPAGECHYPQMCCGDTIATCASGHWQVQPGGCIQEPQPPPCPDVQPNDGDPCTDSCLPVSCPYGTCPGSTGPAAFAWCNGGHWSVMKQCDTGGGVQAGGACGSSANGAMCAAGLACCYPCGMPGCTYTCVTACAPDSPGCTGGCMLVP